jgi:hypothetical protein
MYYGNNKGYYLDTPMDVWDARGVVDYCYPTLAGVRLESR